MDLKEMGVLLKEARERKGLTLEDVAERTKINRRSLEAIEEGRRDRLPHPVYARGFVKNYAALLGLDADKMANVVAIEFGPHDEPEPERISYASVESQEKIRRVKGVIVIAAVIVGVGVLAFLVSTSSFVEGLFSRGDRNLQKIVQTPEEMGRAVPSDTPNRTLSSAENSEGSGIANGTFIGISINATNAANATGPVNASAGAVNATNASGGLVATRPAATVPAAPTSASVPSQTPTPPVKVMPTSTPTPTPASAPAVMPVQTPASAPAAATPAPTPAAKPVVGGRSAELTASAACWVQVKLDDGETREYYLYRGERLPVKFSRSAQIKVGNAGGIRIHLDGKEVPVEGGPGDVRTINLP